MVQVIVVTLSRHLPACASTGSSSASTNVLHEVSDGAIVAPESLKHRLHSSNIPVHTMRFFSLS